MARVTPNILVNRVTDSALSQVAPLASRSMLGVETGIGIAAVRALKPQEWDAVWVACPHSTYFHSREWAELWGAYTGGQTWPDPRHITFSDGRTAVVPLSAERRAKGLVTGHLSSPGNTFGGWLSTDVLTEAHAARLAEYLLADVGDIVWRLNPYNTMERVAASRTTLDEQTQALELRDGFEAVWRRWSKGHRSATNKARRNGVEVFVARTVEEWRAFHRVYEDSVRRWGDRATSRYRWDLLEAMHASASRDIRLWLARHGDTVVAGALCLYAPRHVAYWLGGALESAFDLRPVQLVMATAIADACRSGQTWFDFNPSGGHEGVAAFKRRFGPATLSAPIVIGETRRGRLIGRIADVARGR